MKCQLCKNTIDTPDYGDGVLDYSDAYEYRGFYFHSDCFGEGQKKVEHRRREVSEMQDHSALSQRRGAFQNGHKGSFASDGLPIIEIKEHPALTDFEKGNL